MDGDSAVNASIHRQIDEILGASGEAVIVVDATGALTFVSDGLAKTLGQQRQDLVGTSMFDLLKPEDVAHATELFEQRGRNQGVEMPSKLRHSSGEWLSVFVHARSLTNSSLGVAAIHIYSDDGIVARESLLRRQLATEQYCSKLAADLVRVSAHDDIIERLEHSLAEVAAITGAQVSSILLSATNATISNASLRGLLPNIRPSGKSRPCRRPNFLRSSNEF